VIKTIGNVGTAMLFAIYLAFQNNIIPETMTMAVTQCILLVMIPMPRQNIAKAVITKPVLPQKNLFIWHRRISVSVIYGIRNPGILRAAFESPGIAEYAFCGAEKATRTDRNNVIQNIFIWSKK